MSSKSRVPGPVDEPTENLSHTPDLSETPVRKTSAQTSREPGEVDEQTQKIKSDFIADENMESSMPENKGYISWIVIAFFFSWLFYILISALITASNNGILVVLPLWIVTMLFIGALAWLIFREWRAFQTFDLVLNLRESIQEADASSSSFKIKEQFNPILKNFREAYPEEMETFDAEAKNRDTFSDYVSLIDNLILCKADLVVDREIKKASLSVAALVSVSPHPVLDATLVMIRATMMIKKIGECYGLQPTRWTSLRLFKHLLISAISSAIVEEVSAKIIEDIGAGITEKTLKVASEALVSSSRMYRLGYLTKEMIRPVPIQKN